MAPSNTTPPYLYILGGLLALYAGYTARSQLKAFKARCVSKPPQQSNDAAVDRSTEDGSSSDIRMVEQILTIPPTAIKLETLEELARGINFDLRNAALKIITDRATTPETIEFLLDQIPNRPHPGRLRALKALRCLAGAPVSFSALCTARVFRTLVAALKSTLPPSSDSATEKEALFILTQLMRSYFAAKEMAVQAGIVDWLKAVDRSVVDVMEVLSYVNDTMEGRRLIIEAGIVPDPEDQRVEVEVEVEALDVERAQRAQRAWEDAVQPEAGTFSGNEGESQWTGHG